MPATQCSRLSRQYLEQQRLLLGEAKFNQEYMCSFLDNSINPFSWDMLQNAMGGANVHTGSVQAPAETFRLFWGYNASGYKRF